MLKIYAKIRFGHFYCVLAFSVICRPIHLINASCGFQDYQKGLIKKQIKGKSGSSKNTLSGPTNCKKTTRHYVHRSLRAKPRKTNDAKLRKWPKTSI